MKIILIIIGFIHFSNKLKDEILSLLYELEQLEIFTINFTINNSKDREIFEIYSSPKKGWYLETKYFRIEIQPNWVE